MKKYFYILILLWLDAFSLIAAIPDRPVPPRLVNDFAGLFTTNECRQLEQTLTAFNDSTSNQIVVLTVADLDGEEVSSFAYQVGEHWQVGQREFDNGIVILIKPKTDNGYGEVFIATGYGLEGALPDAVCKTIVEREMIPQFRYNNYFEGLTAALAVIMPVAAGEYSAETYTNKSYGTTSLILGLLGSIIIIIIIMIKTKNNTPTNIGNGRKGSDLFAWWMLGSILGSGRHSGSWGSFSGGGFGGFGGGSFGGGGAGGRW